MKIEPVAYELVASWRSQAARDHVALGPTANTTWYGVFTTIGPIVGGLAGVAGLIRVGKARRIKGVWVRPEVRGHGFGTFLTERLIELHRDELLEVLAYNPAFYQERGFALVGTPRPGVSRLVRRPG